MMTPDDQALLTHIEALNIDPPGAQFGFVDRLARDNGWTHAHANAVDREYRRFLFLAATGTDPVTPSDAVDQAWHLHLTYSRSYWDDLCGRILGKPLHHGPTAGGAAEDARYQAQYETTLARYATVFGEAPPRTIWPTTDIRFTDRFVRTAAKPRPRFTASRVTVGTIIAMLVGLVIGMTTDSLSSGIIVGSALALGLVAATITTDASGQPRKKSRESDGGDCDITAGADGCGSTDSGHGCGSGCGGGCGGD